MTDNKIIIGGVDVSGCSSICRPTETTIECTIEMDYCGNYPNCCYKQLQCKIQECETLEKEKTDKINLLAQIIKILYPNATEDELFDVAFNCEFINKAKQIMQALEEIEEYAKTTLQMPLERRVILDIISRAKGEKND